MINNNGKYVTNVNTQLYNTRLYMESERNLSHVQLYFSNMCKEIIWTFRFHKKNYTIDEEKNNVLDWTNLDLDMLNKNILEFQIKFNGAYREQWKPASYFNLVQPYYRGYSSLTKNIFLYSFALHPGMLQPSGAVNLDKIYDFSILVNISNYELLIYNNFLHFCFQKYHKT